MKNGSPKPKSSPPNSDRGRLGRRGEDLAVAFLAVQGFEIVDRNWCCRVGEIDLVVRHGQDYRFVEVKTRRTHAYGYPESSVTAKKLRHLAGTMELWLRAHGCTPKTYQVDVLAISILSGQTEPQIEWIQGV